MQLQLKRVNEFAIAKGLCVNLGKCATMVCNGDDTGGHQLWYQSATLPVAQELKYLGMWMDKDMPMPLAIRRARGGMMAAWRDLVPIACASLRGCVTSLMQ
jgi:hypothetical protein